MAIKPTRPTAPAQALRSNPATFSPNAEASIGYQWTALPDWIEGMGDYVDARADEALAAALGGDLPPLTGKALNMLRVNAGATAAEFRTPAQVLGDLGIPGIGSENVTAINNANTITRGGQYLLAPGATGSPNGAVAHRIIHLVDVNTQFAGQIAQEAGTGLIRSRHEQDGAWGAWTQFQVTNPIVLTATDTVNGGFGGNFTGRNNGGGVGTGVAFDANIRGHIVGGLHVTDDSEFGAAVRLLANRTGLAEGDRRFTALQVDRNGARFTPSPGAPATLLPSFDCRAWVNFNGTNAAIRASGNVSSVVRNGVGDYTINFTSWMPDANYGVMITASSDIDRPIAAITTLATGSVRIFIENAANFAVDPVIVTVAIFR